MRSSTTKSPAGATGHASTSIPNRRSVGLAARYPPLPTITYFVFACSKRRRMRGEKNCLRILLTAVYFDDICGALRGIRLSCSIPAWLIAVYGADRRARKGLGAERVPCAGDADRRLNPPRTHFNGTSSRSRLRRRRVHVVRYRDGIAGRRAHHLDRFGLPSR